MKSNALSGSGLSGSGHGRNVADLASSAPSVAIVTGGMTNGGNVGAIDAKA